MIFATTLNQVDGNPRERFFFVFWQASPGKARQAGPTGAIDFSDIPELTGKVLGENAVRNPF